MIPCGFSVGMPHAIFYSIDGNLNQKEVMMDTLENLETLVDTRSLRAVLDDLAEIAELKAAHVRENWQDEALARQ